VFAQAQALGNVGDLNSCTYYLFQHGAWLMVAFYQKLAKRN
jgi:hypothetical protein